MRLDWSSYLAGRVARNIYRQHYKHLREQDECLPRSWRERQVGFGRIAKVASCGRIRSAQQTPSLHRDADSTGSGLGVKPAYMMAAEAGSAMLPGHGRRAVRQGF